MPCGPLGYVAVAGFAEKRNTPSRHRHPAGQWDVRGSSCERTPFCARRLCLLVLSVFGLRGLRAGDAVARVRMPHVSGMSGACRRSCMPAPAVPCTSSACPERASGSTIAASIFDARLRAPGVRHDMKQRHVPLRVGVALAPSSEFAGHSRGGSMWPGCRATPLFRSAQGRCSG